MMTAAIFRGRVTHSVPGVIVSLSPQGKEQSRVGADEGVCARSLCESMYAVPPQPQNGQV